MGVCTVSMKPVSHRSFLSVWVISAMTALLAGCYTTSQMVNYCLTEPTAPLVRHRVAVGDQLEVRLKNSTTHNIEVSEISDVNIGGKDGTTFPIDMIEAVTCTTTELEPTWITEGVMGGAAEGAAPLLAIFVIPAWWGKALYEQSLGPIRDWSNDQLCRTLNLSGAPEHVRETGNARSNEKLDLTAVIREIERRELDCDPKYLAEKNCASLVTHGPSFTRCVAIVEPLESYGPDGVKEWGDQLLCEAGTKSETALWANYNVPGLPSIRGSILKEMDVRNVDCASFGFESTYVVQRNEMDLIAEDPVRWESIIRQMQLSLQIDGLYRGPIDGVIPGNTILDEETLQALHVVTN